MKYFFILLISILIMAEGCRPPRCPLPNCYVRMKHRHGGENWKAASAPSDFDPDKNPNANRGKEFRGVPWWKKNKNPKIGDGYKPGYKYDHRKPKPKKQRKKKDLPEEQVPATEEDQISEEEESMEGDQPQAEEKISEQPQEESVTEQEPKKKKGLFRKREKKEKQKDAEKPVIEEPEEEKKQDKEADGF